MQSFYDFNIDTYILDSLNENNIVTPTPIQEKAIPLLLEKKDVIGQAQTGTGKTFAYTIPLLKNINLNNKCISSLILCPTRELSLQVTEEIKKLIKYNKKINVATIYGGASYDKQFKDLKRNPQIVVGTPGRIIDLMNKGALTFANITYLVLDEADEMLKMGFQEDLETIMASMPETRQTALFSATLPPYIKNLTKKYMTNPEMVVIKANTLTVEAITQKVYFVKKDSKKDLLIRLLDYNQYKCVMIFSNTKAMVDELVLFLQGYGYKADGLHGDLKQSSRDRVMSSFRSQNVSILIATDVAARGIDVDGVDCVINYDIPNENELYVHRIGRTARKGTTGDAITLATSRGKSRIAELEAYTKGKINVCEIPTVKEIQNAFQKKLYLNIVEAVEATGDTHEYDQLIAKLARQNSDPVPLLNALIKMIDANSYRQYPEIETITFKSKSVKKDRRNSKSNKDTKNPKQASLAKAKDNKKENKKPNADDKQTGSKYKDNNYKPNKNLYSIIELNLGKADNVKANQLVVFLHDEYKVHRESVGKIQLNEKFSLVEIKKESLKFLSKNDNKKLNGKNVKFKIIQK